MGDEIRVLSAGAIEPGLVDSAAAFLEQGGCEVKITWATTPVILKRIGDGEKPDVVIANREAFESLAHARKLDAADGVSVGRVGIGMVVRDRAPAPDISSIGALKYALLDADSVVFNRASSGLQVERLFREMGVLERIQSKVSRYNNGPAMMDHLMAGKVQGKEIGFGAIVEILMFRDQGLRLAAPLPPEVQYYTEYVAAPMSAAEDPDGARAFVQFLGTAEARGYFAACGVEE